MTISIAKPETERYWTHRPLLRAAVQATGGAVLELGSGDGSTTMLHKMCAESDRIVLTADNDWSWFVKWQHLRSYHHRMLFIRDWAEVPLLPVVGDRWGVVLVDNAPAKRRRIDVARFQGSADIIVVHDTEAVHETIYGFSEDLWDRFTFVSHDDRAQPRTTALSDKVDLSEWQF